MLAVTSALALSYAPTASLRPAAAARTSVISAAARPELLVYDHCPFCVRVRLGLGYLGKDYKLTFMENDDVETPTALVGKKIAPIWVDSDGPMAESLDIIKKVDTENKIAPSSGRTDLKAWQKSVQTLMRKLQRPRYVMVPLPEFMQKVCEQHETTRAHRATPRALPSHLLYASSGPAGRPRCLRRQPPDASV